MTATTNASAFRNFGLAASGAILAASAWAAGAAPEGLGLDARVWREEMSTCGDEDAAEGWYEIAVQDSVVDVRAVPQPSPAERAGRAAAGAMLLHLPGTPLAEGLRINHGYSARQLQPVKGIDYHRSLGRTEYSFRTWSNAVGTAYVIRYDGADHEYLLGLPAAATKVHAIADFDGDRKPDFVVEVGGEMFLLLSTHARPGINLPSAQFARPSASA